MLCCLFCSGICVCSSLYCSAILCLLCRESFFFSPNAIAIYFELCFRFVLFSDQFDPLLVFLQVPVDRIFDFFIFILIILSWGFDQVDRSFIFGCFSVDHVCDLFGDVFPRAKNRHIDQVDRTLGGSK